MWIDRWGVATHTALKLELALEVVAERRRVLLRHRLHLLVEGPYMDCQPMSFIKN